MIPDEVRNPEKYWTPIATAEEADALVERYKRDDPTDNGNYIAVVKGAGFAIAYYEDGKFCAYV